MIPYASFLYLKEAQLLNELYSVISIKELHTMYEELKNESVDEEGSIGVRVYDDDYRSLTQTIPIKNDFNEIKNAAKHIAFSGTVLVMDGDDPCREYTFIHGKFCGISFSTQNSTPIQNEPETW